jgi:hypothetical protein
MGVQFGTGFRASTDSLLDTGCWMLDAGCWMLDAGCWLLIADSLSARILTGEQEI